MTDFEVPEPILNSPYKEPQEYWHIVEGETPVKITGRRSAGYYFRDPHAEQGTTEEDVRGILKDLPQVNLIRERVKQWQDQGYPGVTRTTLDLLTYWQRDGRETQLFFAQLEAAKTVLFLKEARQDFLQGIVIPKEELTDKQKENGYSAFTRYACKMATGSGKTMVMGMLIAWSVLNKISSRADIRFSDVVLVVCPNITIKNRLRELDPNEDDASIYRTRDLVPPHLMPNLRLGKIIITNWHYFEPKSNTVAGDTARVVKAGIPVRVKESISIGPKTTTARGTRYLSLQDYQSQLNAGLLTVLKEEKDKQGNLKKIFVESTKYIESEKALVNRVLGREIGSKENILVINDEAHHAYRIQKVETEEGDVQQLLIEDDEEDDEDFTREATIWIEGLDKINKQKTINFCVDLSATPYYLNSSGQKANQIFEWVISDFGLTDAIESGLVKIPQLVVRDTTGAPIPSYFNIWQWILTKLTPAERGGKKASPKPEAILKWAHTPIVMLAGLWRDLSLQWKEQREDPRSPVFIIVCKNTKIAKVIFEWLAENRCPPGVPQANIQELLNTKTEQNTIRVDSKIVSETDSDTAKNDESRWMRHTLDTVGKIDWPRDKQKRPIYPEGFEELAKKLKRPLHPPGRNVKCIISVSMLTEGWDCNTVTHIIGLRPFMSQLLCEQVVGRALRRSIYDVGENGRLSEEVAKVFGVPFEIIPFKKTEGPIGKPSERRFIHAIPQKAQYEIKFPRVVGYHQTIHNRITIDWDSIAPVKLDPMDIPPEVEIKASLLLNRGRPSLSGPGKLERVDLNPLRQGRRLQELTFEIASDLTKEYVSHSDNKVPAHVLFPQILKIVQRFLSEKVKVIPPADILDSFCSPYYGWIIERVREAIKPDTSQGEEPERPTVEKNREMGSTADIEFWSSRRVNEVVHSHINYIVMDTQRWEQSTAYILDTHPAVEAFVKNAGLGFGIPYIHDGQPHDFIPDFIIRLDTDPPINLILETKGFDRLAEIKQQAAERWIKAVNAEKKYGLWTFKMSRNIDQIREYIDKLVEQNPRSKNDDMNMMKIGEQIPLKNFQNILKNEEIGNFPIEIINEEIILDIKKTKPDTIYSIQIDDNLIGLRFTNKNCLEMYSIEEREAK